jgi:DNA-binding GntR family transcriptional regulator
MSGVMPTLKRAPDLRRQIFDQLRAGINAGTIPRDERLTEMTVAKLYNVSRTPAREALALLSQAGLLAQDERGYRVPGFSRKDIDDVFEVRHLIEPFAVACIARDATDAELKSLARFAHAELKRDGDNDGYVEANKRIRQRLFALLRNDKLQQLIGVFEDRQAFIRMRTLHDPAIRRISAEGNARLIDAVTTRDAQGAEACMHYLLTEARKAVISLL